VAWLKGTHTYKTGATLRFISNHGYNIIGGFPTVTLGGGSTLPLSPFWLTTTSVGWPTSSTLELFQAWRAAGCWRGQDSPKTLS